VAIRQVSIFLLISFGFLGRRTSTQAARLKIVGAMSAALSKNYTDGQSLELWGITWQRAERVSGEKLREGEAIRTFTNQNIRNNPHKILF